MPDWKKKRGLLNRTLEKVEDLPVRAMSGKRPLTDSAKRELYANGVVGQALIIEPPPKTYVSDVSESAGPFRVKVDLPGREPYEARFWQSFGRYEWDRMQPGALVECRVDSEKEERVLLVVPEPGEVATTVMDSASILKSGKRANAAVLESAPLGKTAPGTNDPFYLLNLELSTDAEPKPWKVQIGQRVPEGAETLVAAGEKLEVAYLEVDSGDSVAVDWPASSGNQFS